MEREIYIIDENNQEYLLKYVDKERIIVQQVTRYEGKDNAGGIYTVEDFVQYSMPCKVTVNELYKWPYTDGLKEKIVSWHAEFPDAE
jgi:hypothetical protein|tara:strand:- start:571 stop:831 length:261 start_codon:yes stop_codon:yes gene_type:complete